MSLREKGRDTVICPTHSELNLTAKGQAVGQTDQDVSSENNPERELYLRGVHTKEIMCTCYCAQQGFPRAKIPTPLIGSNTCLQKILDFEPLKLSEFCISSSDGSYTSSAYNSSKEGMKDKRHPIARLSA